MGFAALGVAVIMGLNGREKAVSDAGLPGPASAGAPEAEAPVDTDTDTADAAEPDLTSPSDPLVREPVAASGASEPTLTEPAASPAVDRPPRLLVVGDSVAAQIGWSLEVLSSNHPDRVEVWNESHIGCGTVRHGFKRVGSGEFGPVGDICSNWGEPVSADAVGDVHVVSWPTAVEVFDPDAVVSIISAWDVTDRIVPGVVEDWASAGDRVYDEYVRQEYRQATEVLTAGGATLYWLVSPVLNLDTAAPDHAARIDRINRIVREVAAEFPDRDVRFVDYPAFIGEIGSEREHRMRHDGVHLSLAGFVEVGEWLLGEIDFVVTGP